MVNYNSVEKLIAKVLSASPKTKKTAKMVYQFINYLLYKKRLSYITEYQLKDFSQEGYESFFGYYDKSPSNKSGKYLIFHSTSFSTRSKPGTGSIDIILYNTEFKKVIKKFKTCAYNWQQGAKLQWIDNARFVFNDFDPDRKNYCSRIYNVENEKEELISYPIYDVFEDFALSLNFERLHIVRPDYGYRSGSADIDFSKNDKDGIFYVDLLNNTAKLVITLENVIKAHFKDSMKGAKHWFNHIMISPNGKKFIFLHRWLDKGKKFDALVLADVHGEYVSILADDDMVSHCCWYGNDKVISYMRDKEHGDGYYIMDLKAKLRNKIENKFLQDLGDGHPSIYNDLMLIDTYPDKARMKGLYIYDFTNNKLTKLGEFFESMKFYGETRCDLHPKFDYSGEKIFFDSIHEGKRYLYYISLLENKK